MRRRRVTEGLVLGSQTRIFISMDATHRRDRLAGLLSAYGDFDVVGAGAVRERPLRAIIARKPDLLILAPHREALPQTAWLIRRVEEMLPTCTIVAAVGEREPLIEQRAADRRLPVDAPLPDLLQAALDGARAHRREMTARHAAQAG
jgi:hypothetical protein